MSNNSARTQKIGTPYAPRMELSKFTLKDTLQILIKN
jgi:hypothetical protein